MSNSSEYLEGYRAFNSGASVDSCPYVGAIYHRVLDEKKYEDWVNGWNDALWDSQERS